MNYYNTLFLILYNFFDAIDAGLAYQTKNNRALVVILIITGFEMLNLLSILPKPPKVVFWTEAAFVLGVNFLVFLLGDRFLKVLKKFDQTPPTVLSKLFAYGYITLTIAGFIYTR
jgi:hypothetical protein